MSQQPNQAGQTVFGPTGHQQPGQALTPVPFEQPTSLAILRDRTLSHNTNLASIHAMLAEMRSKVMGESEQPFEIQQRLTSSCAVGEIEGALNAQEDLVAAILTHVQALQRL